MNPPKMNANIYCNGQFASRQQPAFTAQPEVFTAKAAKNAKKRLKLGLLFFDGLGDLRSKWGKDSCGLDCCESQRT